MDEIEALTFEYVPGCLERIPIKYPHCIKHNHLSTPWRKKESVSEFLNLLTLPRNRMNVQKVFDNLTAVLATECWAILEEISLNIPLHRWALPSQNEQLVSRQHDKATVGYCIRLESNCTRNPITKCPTQPHSSPWQVSSFWGRRSAVTLDKPWPICLPVCPPTLPYWYTTCCSGI